MNIPKTLRAGDTIEWDESRSDYPASDGWTLAFVLTRYGQSLITITASASGDNFAISVLPSISRTWIAGIYSWMAYVYKFGGTPVRYTLESGQIEILPDITQAILTTDLRSFAKKNLEMIEAALSGDTSPLVMSYAIAGRSLAKRSREELIKERSYWRIEYEREVEAEGIARGEDSPRRVGVRFRRV